MKLKTLWNKYEDAFVLGFHGCGLFKLDARVRKLPFDNPSLDKTFNNITNFLDGTGLTTKNFLDRYNYRHPEVPLSSPYEEDKPEPHC